MLSLCIFPFHKSQDTLLHPGLNYQIQNTLFTEVPHVTRAPWGGFDWQPGSGSADLNWSALVNHIGIHPLPATQPTLIGPRPSQFSVPRVPLCTHGNGKIFGCNILLIKIVSLEQSPAQNHYHRVSFSGVVVWPKWQKIGKITRYFLGTNQVIIVQISVDKQHFVCLNIKTVPAKNSLKNKLPSLKL